MENDIVLSNKRNIKSKVTVLQENWIGGKKKHKQRNFYSSAFYLQFSEIMLK
jgi:hypothetical protein